mmetsp:Transcript_26929/g.65379  ORF Transcript_26929/g.65379 Transcript_26929/m.65379 type:complete len:360 (+) Transcript_26929:471-1550(+)
MSTTTATNRPDADVALKNIPRLPRRRNGGDAVSPQQSEESRDGEEQRKSTRTQQRPWKKAESCPVCIQVLKRSKRAVLEVCGHAFCFTCILPWSQLRNTCPLCCVRFRNIQRADGSKIIVDNINKFKPDEPCMVCYRADNDNVLLICDECDDCYHTYCLDPPLDKVPDGQWFCKRCSDKKYADEIANGKQEREHKNKKSPGPKMRKIKRSKRVAKDNTDSNRGKRGASLSTSRRNSRSRAVVAMYTSSSSSEEPMLSPRASSSCTLRTEGKTRHARTQVRGSSKIMRKNENINGRNARRRPERESLVKRVKKARGSQDRPNRKRDGVRKKVHRPRKTGSRCPFCKQTFNTPRGLNAHLK